MTGRERFDTYLTEWEHLAKKASSSADAADYCLNNDARTIFFMAEGLCRVYKNLHNEKLFGKLGDKFKAVEDLIGDMDHYRECIDAFTKMNDIPDRVVPYFRDQYEKSRKELNTLLKEKGWLNGSRADRVRKKLKEADWMNEHEELNGVRKFYDDEIEEFRDLYKQTGTLSIIEDHLHEFRRRLRWFSIYPHALQGAIQLTEGEIKADSLIKYQTEEIVSSPFNKLPSSGNQSYTLLLDRSCFLALSWLIDALGTLKDKGLLEEALLHALEATGGKADLSNTAKSEQEILREANNILKIFMDDQVLEFLVKGVQAAK